MSVYVEMSSQDCGTGAGTQRDGERRRHALPEAGARILPSSFTRHRSFFSAGRPSVQQAPPPLYLHCRLTLALPVGFQVKGMEQMGKAEAKGKEVGQAVVTERSADHAKPPANPVNRTGVWPKFPHVTYIHKVYICIHQGRRSGL